MHLSLDGHGVGAAPRRAEPIRLFAIAIAATVVSFLGPHDSRSKRTVLAQLGKRLASVRAPYVTIFSSLIFGGW